MPLAGLEASSMQPVTSAEPGQYQWIHSMVLATDVTHLSITIRELGNVKGFYA